MKETNDNLSLSNKKHNLEDVSDKIDFRDIIYKLWRKRSFIVVVSVIFLLIGVIIAFSLPNEYTAQSVIFPQGGRQSSTGSAGNLASIIGVNIGSATMNEGNISPSLYPQIINSLPYVREIMKTSIVVEKSMGEKITLYEFYTNPIYAEPNVFANIKKYTISLPSTIISSFKSKQRKNKDIGVNDSDVLDLSNDSTEIINITTQEQRVYNIIVNNILYEYNSRQGIIKLGYSFPEALGAAQVSEQLHIALEKYVIDYKTESGKENLSFIEQNLNKARQDFQNKQSNLAEFQDSNRGLITATGRANETRLRSEYDIAFTIYNELARQFEQAKLAIEETKPVLSVVNPVIIPLKGNSQNRLKIIAAFLVLGIFIGIVWILIVPFFRELITEERIYINTKKNMDIQTS